MSAKNGDLFRVEYTVPVKEGWELPKEVLVSQKIKCYQSMDPHTIGEFIAFPDWDKIQYFNTKTKEIHKVTIR